jgi:hypothetical protein
MEDRGSILGNGKEGILSLRHRVQTDSGAHRKPFPWGVKWPGREAVHSPPSSVEVKNAWSFTTMPPTVVKTAALLKAHIICNRIRRL